MVADSNISSSIDNNNNKSIINNNSTSINNNARSSDINNGSSSSSRARIKRRSVFYPTTIFVKSYIYVANR